MGVGRRREGSGRVTTLPNPTSHLVSRQHGSIDVSLHFTARGREQQIFFSSKSFWLRGTVARTWLHHLRFWTKSKVIVWTCTVIGVGGAQLERKAPLRQGYPLLPDGVATEGSPKHSSQSNGHVERTIRSAKNQVWTCWHPIPSTPPTCFQPTVVFPFPIMIKCRSRTTSTSPMWARFWSLLLVLRLTFSGIPVLQLPKSLEHLLGPWRGLGSFSYFRKPSLEWASWSFPCRLSLRVHSRFSTAILTLT